MLLNMLHISAFFTFSNVLLKKSNGFRTAELNVIQSVNCNTFSADCRHSFDIVLCQFIVLLIKLTEYLLVHMINIC